MEKLEENKITPSQYFSTLKNAKNTLTTDALKQSYNVFIKLGEKYNKIGQKESLKKLCLAVISIVLLFQSQSLHQLKLRLHQMKVENL